MKNTNEQVIEFLKENKDVTRNQIGEAINFKGLPLFNVLKKMLTDELITTQGDGAETTYSLTEPQNDAIVEEKVIAETSPEQTNTPLEEVVNEQVEPVIEQAPAKNSAGRNNDKYKFNGEEYGKGPLVRALIAKVVADNQGINNKTLKEKFPDDLIPRFGVFQDVEKAREISGAKYDRYFFKEEQVIKLKDKKIVVCNQITFLLIEKIIVRAKELGYDIQ